jgi:hypothetical protein
MENVALARPPSSLQKYRKNFSRLFPALFLIKSRQREREEQILLSPHTPFLPSLFAIIIIQSLLTTFNRPRFYFTLIG